MQAFSDINNEKYLFKVFYFHLIQAFSSKTREETLPELITTSQSISRSTGELLPPKAYFLFIFFYPN
jgi:hypothetical protein